MPHTYAAFYILFLLLAGFVNHVVQGLDFFGGVPVRTEDLGPVLEWEAGREEDRVVVLSDLWLDRPETLDRLETVLDGG